uniref:Uncharacterized protein n=1 Tax=Tanacetum cinerariifolium TaxID=118510 RepID=A0A699HFT0_TANCI|nr:hypothetical protein [Tanacetum cinerariifolium]
MKVADVMISDAIKKKAGYTYYMAKKVESEKAKIVDEPEEQHASSVKSRSGKGFMCYGNQVANVPNKLKKDVVPRKTRSLTIAEEAVEIFPNENAHHIPSLPVKKIPYPTTTPQPSSRQAKAKKLMKKAKNNMRKINFKKAVAHKFKEYDQKLEALTNFNDSKAFEKAVQAKVLIEIKKLLPTHIPNAIVNYVRPHLNTSALEDELTITYLKGGGLERLKVEYNNDVEIEYHVCQLKVAVLSEAQWNSDEGYVSKPISSKQHMSKSTKPHPCFYNNDNSYLVDLSTEEKYTTSNTKHYATRYYKKGIEDMIPER